MTRRAAWAAWLAWLLSASGMVLALVLVHLTSVSPGVHLGRHHGVGVVGLLQFETAGAVGAVVLQHRPRNAVGRLLLGLGVVFSVAGLSAAYGEYDLLARHGRLGGGLWSAWLTGWVWIVILALLAELFLRFPTGTPPAGRWRHLHRVVLVSATLMLVSFPFREGPVDETVPLSANPVGLGGAGGHALQVLGGLGFLLLTAGLVLSALSLVARYRTSSEVVERAQLRWLALAATVAALAFAAEAAVGDAAPLGGPLKVISALSLAGCFVAIGVAVLRLGLYDIDVVVSRSLSYAMLAALATAAFLAVTLGVGALVSASTRSGPGLPVAGTALAAAALAPARARAQRLANRFVYGYAITPVEVLAGLSHRLSAAGSPEVVLAETAAAAGRGLRARRCEIVVELPDGGERSACWPDPTAAGAPDLVAPILHAGERVGELRATTGRGPSEQAEPVLDELLVHAGLALANLRLGLELETRLADVSAQEVALRSLRRRLVEAQDGERRRLERDLHDGAQQDLVTLSLRLAMVSQLLTSDPQRAAEVLGQLSGQVGETMDALRELARGLYPPVLEHEGLPEAIRALARRSSQRVEVEIPEDLPRAPRVVEAAVYFCCREALQNAAKHAPAAVVTVRMSAGADLVWEVEDDGPGGDPTLWHGSGLQNMADRAGSLGGAVQVDSRPGGGTRVAGRVPTGSPVLAR